MKDGNRFKKIVKTVLLVMLILLSMYQAVFLWSVQLESGPITLPLSSEGLGAKTSQSSDWMLLTPKDMVVYLGPPSHNFTIIKKTSLYYQNLFKESMGILVEAMQNGSTMSQVYHLEDLAMERSLFFDLSQPISHRVLEDVFQANLQLLEGLSDLVKVGILLEPNSDGSRVFFVDETEKGVMVSVSSQKVMGMLSNMTLYLNEIEQKESSMILYKSSISLGETQFEQAQLLPLEDTYWTYIRRIFFNRPFIDEDGFALSDLEDYVNAFEPGTKWHVSSADREMYGKQDRLMTYNQNGLFTYEILSERVGNKMSLSDSFYAVNQFLNKDDQLRQQEYYLAAYEETNQGYVFNFVYRFSDFPVVLADKNPIVDGILYPMQVEVKGDRVVAYRRVLITLEEFVPDMRAFNTDYRVILGDFLEDIQPKKPITAIFLGYYWETPEEARMRFIIEYEGVLYNYVL